MRYTYRNKKTYKLKNKLKLLLTILFAALISTTGYIISRNVFADPSPYGTATVTYNTGVDGQFEDGTTINTVTYNLRKVTTKYSHTPNVEDTGKLRTDYDININTNEVITMPGATNLTVDLYYGGYGINSDWLSVWSGSYPSYTAGSNYNSTGMVTTANGAPDDNNKFGGNHDGNYFVNGIEITYVAHCTLTIPGNSVTFGFKSNSSYAYGYGYYAIVKASESEVTPTIDDIVTGEYKEPLGFSESNGFDGWGTDITTISGNTSVNATYSAPKYSGTYDGVNWAIQNNGELCIGQSNTTQTFTNRSSRSSSNYPWNKYKSIINSVRFFGTVNGKGSMSYMFDRMKNDVDFNFTNFNTSDVTAMTYMFYNSYSVTKLNLTPFDTSNVTNMLYMFGGCSGLSSLDISSFNTNLVTNMSYMFVNCSSLTTIDLTSLNTSNVTDMSSMFSGCRGLTTIDLTPLNTSSVTNMRSMFSGCRGLTTIDLTPLNTSSVTNMSSLFAGCNSLIAIDLAPLNTSNVTEMNSMFYNCIGLTTIDLTPLDTRNVTNMSGMFTNCSNLTILDLTPLDTSNVINMGSMFSSCSGLTNLNLNSFNTNNVTDMHSMFSDCSGLTSLDLTPLETSNVTNMSSMFYECINLTSLDLTPLDTSSVRDMTSMFGRCSSLSSLNLTPLNTSNVTNMSSMFYECINLTSLDLTPLNTNNVTGMSSMFSGCSSLTSLNLTPLNTSNVRYMEKMFAGCSNLQEINLSNFDSTSIEFYGDKDAFYSLPKLNKLILGQMFKMDDQINLKDSWTKQGTSLTYTASELMNNYDGATMSGTYLRLKSNSYYAILYDNGDLVFQLGNTPESGRGDVIETYTDYIDVVYNKEQDIPWYNNRTLVKKIVFNDTITPNNTSYWFYGLINLKSIQGLKEKLNMTNVNNAISMFENCSKLESLDFSSSNYFNIFDATKMFYGCTSLKALNISNFSLGYYVNINNIFGNTPLLHELILGESWRRYSSTGLTGQWIRDGDTVVWDAVSLMDEYAGWHMAGTYRWAEPYAILYDTGEMVFQRGNTPDPIKGNVVGTYTGFENTTYANYSNVPWYSKRTNVTTISFEDVIFPVSTSYWFYGMTNLSSINDIEYLDTYSTTQMISMFDRCSKLRTLDFSNFDTSSVTLMSSMFSGCSVLANLDLSSFDTSNVTAMQYMFSSCANLTSLDISNFDTSNVTNMTHMFSGCSRLRYLNVESFNTSKVRNMESMFNECSVLDDLDLSNFDTSNVTTMCEMFYNCSALYNFDISSFDTSKVTDMESMFDGCEEIEYLDLSHFDTGKVIYMDCMFEDCSSLISLDISSFSTDMVTSMDDMFTSTSRLIMLKLGTDWEFLSDNGLTKSWLRLGDSTKYTAAQLTNLYDGSTMSGTYIAVMTLTVTEEVRGALADVNKDFTFSIYVSSDDTSINYTLPYFGSKTGDLVFRSGRASFTLKHNESISMYLPQGCRYNITVQNDGYTISVSGNNSVLTSDKTVPFISTLEGTTPTGIFLDLIPFIIMILFAVGGLVFIKKIRV